MYYVNGNNKKSGNYTEKRCYNTQPLSLNYYVTSQLPYVVPCYVYVMKYKIIISNMHISYFFAFTIYDIKHNLDC